MKTINSIKLALLSGMLFLIMPAAFAQQTKSEVKIKTEDIKLKTETGSVQPADSAHRVETLSGIFLYQDKKTGNFLLRFNQKLKDDASLELKNSSGKVFFSQALSSGESYAARPMQVGNLPSGIYLIEVKTPDTTFWKKVRIKR
ncbi:MAG TPA: T9SS type A sorting domain-containing protein [Adhaeribacter sp.]|nr:T9SS type A sorting domain-containing protein [Adhaeribacter sp.]